MTPEKFVAYLKKRKTQLFPWTPPPLNDCCLKEAERNVKRHQAVATCDACGSLLLGYGEETPFQRTCRALDAAKMPYAVGKVGGIWVVAKRS
jgi:hypothetical protein